MATQAAIEPSDAYLDFAVEKNEQRGREKEREESKKRKQRRTERGGVIIVVYLILSNTRTKLLISALVTIGMSAVCVCVYMRHANDKRADE